MDFAERLSLWLNAFDAIGLQAAHQSIKAITAPSGQPSRAPRGDPQPVDADLRRVRAALANAGPLNSHALVLHSLSLMREEMMRD